MRSRTQNSIRNILFGTVDKIITLLVPFVIRTIMIKTLGPAYLGLSNLFTSIFTVLGLAELGVGSAMVYAMYRPLAEDNKAAVSALLELYRKVYRIIGIFILSAGLALMPFLHRLIKDGTPPDLNLYIIYLLSLSQAVISYFFGAYRSSLLFAMQRSDINSAIDILVRVVLYAVAITGLLTTKSYYLYASLFPIAALVKNVILSHTVKKHYPEYLCGGTVDRETQIGIFRNVVALFGHKVGIVLANSIDTLSISAFLGLSQIAIYGNYHYVVKSLSTLVGMLSGGITASVGNSLVLESQKKNYQTFVTINFIYVFITGVCCACLISLYQHFINLWVGPDFLFDIDMVILFTVYFYGKCIRQIPLTYKDAAGMWAKDALKPYVEGICNLILNIVLVQIIGVRGVILSTILTMLFIAFPWECRILLKDVFHVRSGAFVARFFYYTLVTTLACFAACRVCELLPPVGIAAFLAKGMVSAAVAGSIFAVLYLPLPEYKSAVQFCRNVIKRGRKQ
ncbi:MAG: lipopolysaccharide biosynthesis protein [Faecousia sp.]